jgi:predicted transcriptional regulator YheO
MNDSTEKKAEIISEILAKHYERGRHDKCKSAVWRNIVRKTCPMSRRTFFRYLKRAKERNES